MRAYNFGEVPVVRDGAPMAERRQMTNIPTDLLRALIAVVDHRSFTKAAASLGVTQPAVSAQIKRLQVLLGCDVFERRCNEVKLTSQGEMVLSYARRLLSLNDQIIQISSSGPRPELVIRVGTPSDYVASRLPNILARFRERWPDVRFIVRTEHFDGLARSLHAGELDLFVGFSKNRPRDAYRTWSQELSWVRGLITEFDLDRPVPLVTLGEHSIFHRIATHVLRRSGIEWETVFTGPSMMSLTSAVTAGLGVMVMLRRRASDLGMIVWEDGPLPKLPDLHGGVYVREGGARAAYEQLADEIAETMYPDSVAAPRSLRAFGKTRTSVA